MSTTAKLGITHIDPNQYQKEVTANTAFDTIDTIAGDIPFSPLLTVGAKVATTITVTVQLRNEANINNAYNGAMLVWLADSANAAPSATAPNGGWAASAGYKIADLTASVCGFFATNASSQSQVAISHSLTGKTWYLHVKLADKVFVSAAIAF